MIKEIFLKWLISIFKSTDGFDNYFNEKIKSFYINKSLSLYRVWGDERKIEFGDSVQVNDAIFNTVSGKITIDDFTFFGHGVNLLTGTHEYKLKERDRQIKVPSEGHDIYIGKGVWVASNVTIIGPCSIGNNSVLAANSLVTGNIMANSLYAGIPAKFIKKIGFEDVK